MSFHSQVIQIYLIFISAIIGAYGTIVGFGGGIFLTPILITIFDYKLSVAVGTVMLALVPSSLLTTWFNRNSGRVDYKMGILLEIPTIAGTVLGAYLLSLISAKELESVFAIFIIVLGLSFLIRPLTIKERNKGLFFRLNRIPPTFLIKSSALHAVYSASVWLVSFFGGLSGVIAGIFGVGGGFLKTPIMVKVFNMPVKVAASTALFMICITSLTGSISHFMLGHLELQKSWPVIVGFIVGAILGKHLHTMISESSLNKLIGLSLILASLVMLANLVK